MPRGTGVHGQRAWPPIWGAKGAQERHEHECERNIAPTIQKPGANTGRLCNPLLRESCLWSTLDPSALLPVGKRKSASLTLK